VIVAGGVGVAPFPFLTDRLRLRKKAIITFVGARSSGLLAVEGLENVRAATDDGTEGFRGNVVELLASAIGSGGVAGPKIFGCGPTPMLKALQALALGSGIPCELSLEGDMACGVGICQGCPVRRTEGAKKYALTCTEGPAFAASEITLD
jgi:dihydroorotate dehydrogenase electron transfer subunit